MSKKSTIINHKKILTKEEQENINKFLYENQIKLSKIQKDIQTKKYDKIINNQTQFKNK